MKKITLLTLFLMGLCGYSQCLTSVNGQWPTGTYTPNSANCDGITVQNATTCGYASEYSVVAVQLGQTYTFGSSVATDVITISTDAGATAATFGTGSVTWVSTVTGNVRFYTHLSAACDAQSTCRTKTVICGVPSTDAPDYVNLQFPSSATIAQGGSATIYGRVYEAGLTDTTVGQAAGITAWVGYSTTNTNPSTWTNWTAATFNVEANGGNDDEYQATIGATLAPGTYYYATRFRLNLGQYVYGGIDASNNGNFWDGTTYLSGVLTVTPPPPPANDECSGAIGLTVNPDYLCGTVTPGTVLGATASGVDATVCGGTEDDDVWFSFEATSTMHKISILNAAGSTTDMYHSLWTGSDCNSLTLVPGTCSDADNSFPSGLTIGQTYFVRVYTWTATPAQNSTFNVCIGTPPPPPANDDCAGAIGLTVNPDYLCGTVTPGTILGATASTVDATACGGTEDDDVWFSFEATATSQRISLTNVAGSTTDLYHSLWTGSDCGSLTLVPGSCSDPNTSNPSGLTIGQTYFLRVYSWSATGGQTSTFNVCIGTPPPPPPAPANDECSGAIGLTVNPDYLCGTVTPGTIAGATASAVDATACGGTEDDDVWFSFEATATSHRISILNSVGSTTDMYHSLWTGADCNSLALVPGSCSDADTSNPSGLTIGQTYFVRVNTWTATPGQDTTFNICVGTPPPPPVNDDCSGAIVVTCGSSTNGTTEGTTNEGVAVCGISGVTTQNTNGVWYKIVGDGSDVTVTTCSPTITTGDSRLAVFTGDCSNLTCIGGNDDASAAGCATNTLASVVSFSTVAGTDYYILVYAYTSNALNFQLNVTCTAACSPATANDDCASAIGLTVGTPTTGADNLCSSASLGVTYPTCASAFATYYDTWYWFDTGSATDFTISLTNQTGTSGFALYSGDCSTLTMVPGSCTTTGASLSLTGLTPATTYFLRVFSTTTAARGSYDVNVSETLGAGSFENGNFTYYPNPVKNVLNLSYNQNISNVEIFNILGQKVSTNKFNANEAQVDMSNLAAGAYMVKVTSEGQVKTIKVIKQ